MKELSIFDIVGPNMIGPSSSHTAGALEIARQARLSISQDISSVSFILYGSFARTYQGHGTDRALLGGILGYDTTDSRIKDAFAMAKQAGLSYEFVPDFNTDAGHPNTVDIIIETTSNTIIKARGVSLGGGEAKLLYTNEEREGV